MCRVSRRFAAAAVIGLCIISAPAAWAEDEDRNDKANRYVITNLDSDLLGAAAVRDTVLQNPWGVAFSPAGSPFWIADNNTGCATLYDGDGTIVPLQVNIPLPGNMVPGNSAPSLGCSALAIDIVNRRSAVGSEPTHTRSARAAITRKASPIASGCGDLPRHG